MKLLNKVITSATLVALSANTLFALDSNTPSGLGSINSIISKEKSIYSKLTKKQIMSAELSIHKMNVLIKEAIEVNALADDGDISAADVAIINSYLSENYGDEWFYFRGESAGKESTGFSALEQEEMPYKEDIALWSAIYNLGFKSKDNHYVSDAQGNSILSFKVVSNYLNEIMEIENLNENIDRSQLLVVKNSIKTDSAL